MILYYYHYIIIIIYILKLCNSELRDYVSINKIRLPITNSIVTSLEPKSWLNKALISTRSKIQDNISIREVIYIPNPLSFECFDDYIDDDHFISCIVDKGNHHHHHHLYHHYHHHHHHLYHHYYHYHHHHFYYVKVIQ